MLLFCKNISRDYILREIISIYWTRQQRILAVDSTLVVQVVQTILEGVAFDAWWRHDVGEVRVHLGHELVDHSFDDRLPHPQLHDPAGTLLANMHQGRQVQPPRQPMLGGEWEDLTRIFSGDAHLY